MIPFALSLSKGCLPLRPDEGRTILRQAKDERRWVVIAVFLFFGAASPAFAQEFPELSGRVVDAADIIPAPEEAALTQKLAALETQGTRQLVVATVPDLQGYEIEDYGYRLGRAWGIGQEGADNGAILLVAPNERKVRIEVGYGLEPILTDAYSSVIINDTILPRFKAGDYPGGIVAGSDAIIAQLQAPPELAEQRAMEAATSEDRGEGGSAFLFIFLGMVLLFVILAMVRGGNGGKRYAGKRRRRGAPIVIWGPGWGGGGGSSGWGGGGSSWGGGGGGFGGFSGGGGSFGGGGASGGW